MGFVGIGEDEDEDAVGDEPLMASLKERSCKIKDVFAKTTG
jgi:hypothetical protein